MKWDTEEYLLHSVNNGNKEKFEWREFFITVFLAALFVGSIIGFLVWFADVYLPYRGY